MSRSDTQSVRLGLLVLNGTPTSGGGVAVEVRNQTERFAALYMQPAEWLSLQETASSLLRAEARAESDRVELERLRAEVEKQKQATRAAWAAQHDALDKLHAAKLKLDAVTDERNAMRQAAPVMLTVLALLADEADEAGLREAALHYTERADHDHMALWLDECRALDRDADSRCAVCGWTLAESIDKGCTRGNCSYRPRPEKLYAPERAAREASRPKDPGQ